MTERVRVDLEAPAIETDAERRDRLRRESERRRAREAVKKIRAEWFAKKAEER